MKYIIRIIVLPFWLIIALVYMTFRLGLKAILFLKYGGEAITYYYEDKVTMNKIYEELKKQNYE